MTPLPRLALATPGLEPDPTPVGLALLASLTAAGCRAQHFRTRSCPLGVGIVGAVTGLPGRHLDSWLMPPDVCRAVFERGFRQADLAVIEGTLDELPEDVDLIAGCSRPGNLGPIAETLDAPVVAVVPCARLDEFHLPRLPRCVDAVLLDGLRRREDFAPLRTLFRLALRKPVLGAIEALPGLRRRLRGTPRDVSPPLDLIDDLRANFLRYANLPALRALAASRPFPATSCASKCRRGRRFRVAYAQDEAFGGYFPDTLETLELLGAETVEFSPLSDESLPEGVDLVILGCGYPDRFAEALAANVSLMSALRAHVCHGQRIYAEGGGAAYLGRSMILDGCAVPGAGIFPFDAVLRDQPQPPRPVERTLQRSTWLSPSEATVRGYLSGRWEFQPALEPGDCPARSGPLTAERDVFFRSNAIGSLIHLHLAALPEVVSAFVGLTQPSLASPSGR